MRYFIMSSNESRLGIGTLLRFSQDEVQSIIRTRSSQNLEMRFHLITKKELGEIRYVCRDLMVLEPTIDSIKEVNINDIVDLNTLLEN